MEGGNLMPWGNRYTPSYEERFEAKVDRSGECHRWTGYRDEKGYGRFQFEGKVRPAHVVALVLEGIDVPSGMTVDHVWARGCKYRDCVRVDHLDVVTYQENNLRSNNRAAIQARMTHCPRGHELSGSNLKIRSCGRRRCHQCQLDSDRERYRRQRAAIKASA
jgi:hypothetical protein